MSTVTLRILGECAIEAGDERIAPDAQQLFALVLYLWDTQGRAVPKAELFDLLFPLVADRRRASHNLRQLVYRVRGLGVPVKTFGKRIQIPRSAIRSTIDDFASLAREERMRCPASSLVILPSYEPTLSPQLSEWVEVTRSTAATRVRAILRDDLRTFQHDCSWSSVVAVGRILRELEVASDQIVTAVAEALLMLGRKHEALDEIDAFLVDCDETCLPALRQLRGRIARAKEHVRPMESAFHGRGEVMRALRRQWSAAMERQTQLGIVVGPPGIGKSRLAREFSTYASLHGGRCLTYRCEAADHTRPLSLFKHILPDLRAMRGSIAAGPASQRQLKRLSARSSASPSMDPASLEATRSKLQLALIDLVQAVAHENTQLLVIDDAQFLDSASRAVITALCSAREGTALLILCCYRGSDADSLSVGTDRACVYQLTPLTEIESLAILTDLLPQRQADRTFFDSSVRRAGGNPYYLHAIAQSGGDGGGSSGVPFDVHSFAAASYFGLASNARTLFEVCLLLGRFATLRRARAIALIDGPPLLAALRTLEEQGLLIFSDGELRCAHTLFEEAVRSLIPSAVEAALNERIAKCLEQECASQGYAAPIAAAAAACWIAAGDVSAANRLLQHCAAHAAALGEPRLAANTLLQVPRSQLAMAERTALLRLIAEYAEAAGSRELFRSTLRDLLAAVLAVPSSSAEVSEIEFRIIEADLRHGVDPDSAIATLMTFVADSDARAQIRVRAGIRLLVAADMNLDAKLAKLTMEHLRPVLSALPLSDPLSLGPELIYETVFGDKARAVEIASTLLAAHRAPDLTQASVGVRRNAAFALSRLGLHMRAEPVLVADYRFMCRHRVTSEAAYRALLLVDNLLSQGDLTGANSWLQGASTLLADEAHTHSLQAGYCSAATTLALSEGRLTDAKRFIEQSRDRYPAVGLRYRAIALSHQLKISVLDGLEARSCPETFELEKLFGLGEGLGAQDAVVEALWLVRQAEDADAASTMLSNYLHHRRRELGEPEASLRSTTARDRAWESYKPSALPLPDQKI